MPLASYPFARHASAGGSRACSHVPRRRGLIFGSLRAGSIAASLQVTGARLTPSSGAVARAAGFPGRRLVWSHAPVASSLSLRLVSRTPALPGYGRGVAFRRLRAGSCLAKHTFCRRAACGRPWLIARSLLPARRLTSIGQLWSSTTGAIVLARAGASRGPPTVRSTGPCYLPAKCRVRRAAG